MALDPATPSEGRPNAHDGAQPAVTIYTQVGCRHCVAAKALLARRSIGFREIDVTTDGPARADLASRTRARTLPQVFCGDEHIGGFEELLALDARQGQIAVT